ncbi:MAG TPA: family 1 encapsulin nanocompartment shell protein [Pseudonocardia sp.]|jgi:uncharacterized linocin/CFP29 family protein|nr:family 1 encapsulin nanocompartment shell protein [Pseudonocardia sp.]
MDHLLREIAPIPEAAWARIDEEARERLTPLLGARRVVDWAGPSGWEQSSVSLGRTEALAGPPGVSGKSAQARQRRVLRLAEVRVPFVVDRDEIDDSVRGARDLEFSDLDRAVREAAEIENLAVFHGWPDAGIEGIISSAPERGQALGVTARDYPGIVAAAVEQLRCAGVEGPYALAVGPDTHTQIMETTESGYLLADHLRKILGGELVPTHGLDGAVVLSQRGGDFKLEVGQDLSVGYRHHEADTVHLYLEETFTFHVTEPDAAIALTS